MWHDYTPKDRTDNKVMGNDIIIQVHCNSQPLNVKCNFGVCLENDGWLCQHNKHCFHLREMQSSLGSNWCQQFLRSWKGNIESHRCGFLSAWFLIASDPQELHKLPWKLMQDDKLRTHSGFEASLSHFRLTGLVFASHNLGALQPEVALMTTHSFSLYY